MSEDTLNSKITDIFKKRMVYISGFTLSGKKSKSFPYPAIREIDLDEAIKEAQAIMKKKVDALKNICNEKFNSVHDYGVFERESDKIFGEEMGNE